MVVASHLELTFRNKFPLVSFLVGVVLKLYPHSNNLIVVLEELLRLFMNHIFDSRGQFHINPGDDDVMLLHICIPFLLLVRINDSLGDRSLDSHGHKKKPTPEIFMKHSEYFSRFSVIIVTGGSSGIGCSIIKAILNVSPEIVLCNISRSKPEIYLGTNGVHFETDLSNPNVLSSVAESLAEKIKESPQGEVLLVNNSGFGDYGCFQDLEPAKQLNMIDLNVRAVVDLTARLLHSLLRRGGVIVNIASTAAFQPTPFLATYGATKAFVRNWSLALNEDLKGTGVRALAVCPGPTRSNFFKAAGFETPPMNQGANKGLDMTSEEVAELTLDAIARGRALAVTGWKNKCIAFFGSKGPLVCVTRIGAMILRKLRLEQHKQ